MQATRDSSRDGLLGRREERALVEQALADARLGASHVLVVRGEPGIGKTALLRFAAERARADGMGVLLARGVESEAEVPFAGLLELLRPALAELERIPPAQAEALRSALDLGPTVERDRFVIGAATLNLLSACSERRPLLVVVDDAHWLDESSLTAVLFAARRLLVDAAAVIFATRTGEASALDAARLPELTLGAVDVDTATEIVARHAAAPPAPGVVERLLRAAAGNPLALEELAAVAGDLPPEPLDEPLAVETSVERAYGQRIAELAPGARAALALAAAEASGGLATIGAAAEALGLDLSALESAERSGLVSIAYGVLSWRHPLARSAAYRLAPAGERRAIHAALARALSPAERDRRAWHLSAAALGADEAVAAELEDAGRRARARSAYAAAATAAERAARLTPGDRDRARRLFLAAEAAWLGGHVERTLGTLDVALALAPEPRLAAEIGHLRGQAMLGAGDALAGRDLLVAAATAIESLDPAKAVVMLAQATEAGLYAGRPDAMLQAARRAHDLLGAAAGERARFFADLALGMALVYNDEGDEGARHLRRAVATLEASDALSGDARLLSAAALGPLWLREEATGASLSDRAVESARRDGALGALPLALVLAARHAATSDRWAVGQGLYEEAIGLARETEQALPLCGALAGVATIHARRGEVAACEAAAQEAVALSERHGLGFHGLWARDALLDLDLGLGRLDGVRERAHDKQRALAALGIVDPDLSPVPELVEAGTRAGDSAGLAAALGAFARAAQGKGQPWALARLERARGLLADDGEAERHFAHALRLHEATPDRFEQSRTRLCYGERLRRARRRAQARVQLRAALEAFDELGAAPWAERARVELLATGERARRRDPSTLDELTPQELQIAMVLAAGHTTREAATRLFLSPKTVEYHLRNAYRKLGIHSREDLVRALAQH